MNSVHGDASGNARLVNIGGNSYGDITIESHANLVLANGLPADISDFTGRHRHVAHIENWLKRDHDLPSICAISGKPGVGKSTLAVHVARRVRDNYPDGQLYANLRGDGSRITDPNQLLIGFLRSLGMRTADIPSELDDRSAAFRSILEKNKVLIILDNAHGAAQVRPLLPANRDCAVLITSRTPLASLENAELVDLDVMELGESVELFRKASKQNRFQQEIDDLEEKVVTDCGRLPLAIRIAGALMKQKKHWSLTKLVNKIADERSRLKMLQLGDLDVRASFMLSYRDLSANDSLVFSLLSLLPRSNFLPESVAEMIDYSVHEADLALERLHDAQLVEAVGGDFFRLHDLIRIFAKEQRQQLTSKSVEKARVGLQRYTADFEKQYRAITRQLGAGVSVTTAKERMRVEEVYVPPQLILTNDTSRDLIGPSQIVKPGQISIVLGEGGMGKTTLLQYLRAGLADGSLPGNANIGLLIRLRDFSSKTHRDILSLLLDIVGTDFNLDLEMDRLAILLHTGRAAILCDGLDEIANPSDLLVLARMLTAFIKDYSRTPVIITSRPALPLEPFDRNPNITTFQLCPLTLAGMQQLLAQLNAADKNVGKDLDVVTNRSAGILAKGNPLHAVLLWATWREQGMIAENIQQLFDYYWHGRIMEGRNSSRLGTFGSVPTEYLAYKMSMDPEERRVISEIKLYALLKEYFETVYFEEPAVAREHAEEFVEQALFQQGILRQIGSGASGDSYYQFFHSSIQSYGAASWMIQEFPAPELLVAKISEMLDRNENSDIAEIAVEIFFRDNPHEREDLLGALGQSAQRYSAVARFLERFS
ncbi:NB-ARC domain-containing protein [Actinomadura scrupuli]|uniref:NB-ARC domain-containing protein n=1 Tax=Actinomadura scrupuli TaxID=559629 RepID=UPI003D984D68